MSRPPAWTLTLLASIAFFASATLAQSRYGSSQPGTGGFTPRISCNQAWMGNGALTVDLDSALPGALAYIVLASLPGNTSVGGTPINVNPGAIIIVDTVTVDANGRAQYPVPLAFTAIPGLAGIPIFAQYLVVDTGAPFGTLAASQGLDIRLTMDREVFVGTSVGGGADPYYLVDPDGFSLDDNASSAFTDNCSGAVFTDFGTDLYVSSSIQGTISHADVDDAANPIWTNFTTFQNQAYGLGYDATNQLLWCLGDQGAGRELYAFSVDQTGPYGLPDREHHGRRQSGTGRALGPQPSGRIAAVLQVFGSQVFIYDTDPNSPTFTQQITTLFVPSSVISPFALNTQVMITPDDDQVLVLIQHAGAVGGELARFSFNLGIWIDHDMSTLAVDNLGANSNPPVPFGSAPAASLSLATESSSASAASAATAGPDASTCPPIRSRGTGCRRQERL